MRKIFGVPVFLQQNLINKAAFLMKFNIVNAAMCVILFLLAQPCQQSHRIIKAETPYIKNNINAGSNGRVRIATFNCKKLRRDEKYRMDHIADMIHQINPEIINLNEIRDRNTLETLTAILNAKFTWDDREEFKPQYLENPYLPKIHMNTCLASRMQPKRIGRIPQIDRSIVAEFEFQGGTSGNFETIDMTVIAVHLKAFTDRKSCMKREWQAEAIANALTEISNASIVMGDFNDSDGTVEAARNQRSPSSHCMQIIHNTRSFENAMQALPLMNKRQSHRSGGLIDHILVDKKIKYGNTNVLQSLPKISDHYPIYTDLDISNTMN